MKFTIGYIQHNKELFNKHLLPSLKKLKESYDIIGISSDTGYPAEIYNRIIDQSPNRYIIFTHEDISFNSNMLSSVAKTIDEVKTFGVLGLVGKPASGKITWSNSEDLIKYITVDCCFFVIDKDTEIRFDQKTFDGLHMYGEDYAMQCHKKGLTNYSIYSNSNTSNKEIAHHSYTCKSVGYMWGDWGKYRNVFNSKWKK